MKMTQADKDEWLAALRSGEYKQGTRFLHLVTGEMCCLGVLCHLQKEKVLKVGYQPILTGEVYLYGDLSWKGGCSTTTLPYAFRKRFDATPVGVDVLHIGSYFRQPISGLNDKGVPFPVIAGLLEKFVQVIDHY